MKILAKFLMLLVIECSFNKSNLNAQQAEYRGNLLSKTSEDVQKYNLSKNIDYFYPVGYLNKNIVYAFENNVDEVEFFVLDESKFTFSKAYYQNNIDGKRVDRIVVQDSLICYTRSVKKQGSNGYNTLHLQKGNQSLTLDSIHDSDKRIHISITEDSKFIVANSLIHSKDYYSPSEDDRIIMYTWEGNYLDKIVKRNIYCRHCADAYIIGERLFFTIAEEQQVFNTEFGYTNIYQSSQSLADSIKIASFSDIIAISPDARYILAKRIFDLPNRPCAIIDVSTRRYQLLLGRDYSNAAAFYSYNKERFAFHFGDRIVYVDMPKEFPFDALQKDNPKIPKWTDKSFYSQFQHKPFEN